VYQEPLERVPPGPQLPFDAVQSLTAVACEPQLAFDVVQRLGRELSLSLRIVCALKVLAHESKGVLGLDHAADCLLRLAD
jgi:hypothetical protein